MFVETKLSYLHRLVFPLTLTQISKFLIITAEVTNRLLLKLRLALMPG